MIAIFLDAITNSFGPGGNQRSWIPESRPGAFDPKLAVHRAAVVRFANARPLRIPAPSHGSQGTWP